MRLEIFNVYLADSNQADVLGANIKMTVFAWKNNLVNSKVKRLVVDRNHRGDFISCLAWEHIEMPQDELRSGVGEKGCLEYND